MMETVGRMNLGNAARERAQGRDLATVATFSLPSASISILLRPHVCDLDAEKRSGGIHRECSGLTQIF
jgi:hypothetical protein